MSRILSAVAVSVDCYISGRDPGDREGGFGRGLGDAPMLFDRYFDGDTPSQEFKGLQAERAERAGLRRGRRPGRRRRRGAHHR